MSDSALTFAQMRVVVDFVFYYYLGWQFTGMKYQLPCQNFVGRRLDTLILAMLDFKYALFYSQLNPAHLLPVSFLIFVLCSFLFIVHYFSPSQFESR